MKHTHLVLIGSMVLFAIYAVVQTLLYLNPAPGDGKVIIHVRFADIEKISPGTRVTYAGKPVGDVKQIIFLSEQDRLGQARQHAVLYPYELILQLDSSVQVFPQDEITVHTAGLMGEKSIAIHPKIATQPGVLPVTSETILYGKEPRTLEESFDEVASLVEKMDVTADRILSTVAKNEGALTSSIRSLDIFLTSLNKEQITTKFANFAQAGSDCFRSFGTLSDKIVHGDGSLGKLVSDNTLIQNLDDATARLNLVLEAIRQYGILFHSNANYKRSYTLEQKQPVGTTQLINTLTQAKKNLLQHDCGKNHEELVESIDKTIQALSNE